MLGQLQPVTQHCNLAARVPLDTAPSAKLPPADWLDQWASSQGQSKHQAALDKLNQLQLLKRSGPLRTSGSAHLQLPVASPLMRSRIALTSAILRRLHVMQEYCNNASFTSRFRTAVEGCTGWHCWTDCTGVLTFRSSGFKLKGQV